MSTEKILFSLEEGCAWITLNRPEALNAFDQDMMVAGTAHLQGQAQDPRVTFLVVTAVGRAFSAGGDLVLLRTLSFARKVHIMGRVYLFYEAMLALAKPTVALINGLAIGGGMAVACFSTYRVVSEKVLFSMPEAALGYFPDIGSSWFLSRAPGKIGLYMGLTAASIGLEDALYAGYATHFVPASAFEQLSYDLKHAKGDDLAQLLARHHREPEAESSLKMHQSLIDDCFSQPTIEAIGQALAAAKTPFAEQALARMKKLSPLSLRRTLEHFKADEHRSRSEVIDADLKRTIDWHADPACLAEMLEGVRALLVDKDRNPHWPSPPITF